MIRFFLAAMLWMCASFVLLWWVQTAVDDFHRHAAQAVGRAAVSDPLPIAGGDDEAAQALADALRQHRLGPQDLAQIEFDRRELMRRLRLLWITLTLCPLLVGAWWATRPHSARMDKESGIVSGIDGRP